MWSNGKELAAPHDFCAPTLMTQSKDAFDACTTIKTESTCMNDCSWYKGTGDVNSGDSTATDAMCMPEDVSNLDLL